jgi:septal ring factor EnvC (AmiA/AmiB activator)
MFKKIVLASLLLATPALAQQPDPAFMQRAINALQTQRNNALDGQAAMEARLAGLTEDLSKTNAKIKELESKNKELEDKLNSPKEITPE